MHHPKILIIGAGAAGIAAASRLIANNVNNITILEAENRIGGRIFTSEFGANTVEVGAQWVHGEQNNVVYSLGSKAGLLCDNFYDIMSSGCVLSDGTSLGNEATSSLFDLCREVVHDEESLSSFNGSLGDYIHKQIREKLKMTKLELDCDAVQSFLDWYQRFQNSLDGSDSWFETSAKGTVEYHECEGNLLTTWKTGGYTNIFNLLMGNNSRKINEKIIFNKTVKRIMWDRQPVEVLCTDGQTLFGDHVLLTLSLGVLKEQVSSLFMPTLPLKKINAIQGLGFGTVDKIFLKFPYRWWPTDCGGFSLLWRKDDVSTISEAVPNWLTEVFGFYSVDGQPQVLCGWIVGQAARHMEQCSDLQVQEGCHELLLRFLGSRYNIPAPDCVVRSQWHSNPHFRGSYSFRSVTSDSTNVTAADLASPLCLLNGRPVVLFGGEATHDHYYSTVHGAIETGWREADRIIELVSNPSKRCKQNKSDNCSDSVSVVIVGAGMAGLGAANCLTNAGITDFIILEGQDQAGGRVCSIPIDNSGQRYAELGAQWIHGEGNPVFELAAEEQLLSGVTSDEGLGLYLKPDGEQISLAVVQEVAGVVGEILEDCCRFVNETNVPESVGVYLNQKFNQYMKACNDPPDVQKEKIDLFDWHVRFQMIDNSCTRLNCLSAKAWGQYQYTGGTDYNNFHHGYCSLVESLVGRLPQGALRTSCHVKFIDYSCELTPVKVVCEDGREYSASHVIVTSSLGYLKENHRTLFHPSLPIDIGKAIDIMGFDTINKLFLVYDNAWWPEDFQGIQLIWNCEEKEDADHQSWVRCASGFDVVADMSAVLLGWVGGEGAVAMEALSDQEVSLDCTRVIRRFMSNPHIPLPERIFRSKWHSNKFVRGGYSHTTAECDKTGCGPDTLAQPIYSQHSSDAKQPVVLLAGEAVHTTHFSTTHGAFLSGVSQAQVIVDYMNKDSV
ncbi:peroxisomal N(1)-acetyl-spermine/spermidine oxidase-like isoform X2 [Homalodisca vitripennis]|nr:peroxisomal N(1)-acetyl-spermine/spermidine oxidase-like isoform X2 [Homalodisca vitripennis]